MVKGLFLFIDLVPVHHHMCPSVHQCCCFYLVTLEPSELGLNVKLLEAGHPSFVLPSAIPAWS
jgi:hypothetical protein